jgi:hypothetical protein
MRQSSRYSEWTPERISSLSKSVAVVLALGIAIGLFAVRVSPYYVAAAACGAALVVLVAWQFEAALALYCVVAFVPWGRTPDLAVGGSGVGKGVYVSEAMLGFLLAIWFAKYLLGSLPKDRPRTGFYVPLGLYLAFCVLNLVHSQLFWDPAVDRMYQKLSVNIIELGLRFLTDYLRGDSYFKLGPADPPDLNRVRGIAQLALFRTLRERDSETREFIETIRKV